MIYHNTTAIDAVNQGIDTPDAFYHKSTLIATSKYVRIDGWRGYTEIVPEPGYKIIDSSWVTGDWSDAPSGHGESEVETILNRLEKEHGTIWVIYTPTSNVFSTSYEVLVKDAKYVKPTDAPKRRKVAHKTYKLEYPNGDWAIQYHATRVVEYSATTGKYTLKSGGWHTMTTAKRMHEALPSGYRVNRKNWELHITIPGTGQVKLVDGMEV